jgi:hypothetical protein
VSVNDDLDRARKVFVVHGRNGAARSALFTFLRALGLAPIEWSEAVRMTGEGSPYIGQMGKLRPFSDVAGRHAVRIDGSASRRKELAQRLESAGCAVSLAGEDWLTAGDFTAPPPPGGGLPLGKRIPGSGNLRGVRLDARFHERSSGGRLEILNRGSEDIYDLDVEMPQDIQGVHIFGNDLPVRRLPAGKSLMLACSLTLPRSSDYFDVVITGRTAGGDAVREEAFVSVLG